MTDPANRDPFQYQPIIIMKYISKGYYYSFATPAVKPYNPATDNSEVTIQCPGISFRMPRPAFLAMVGSAVRDLQRAALAQDERGLSYLPLDLATDHPETNPQVDPEGQI
jgi:hypothetical protein